jgi:hypothetical protein
MYTPSKFETSKPLPIIEAPPILEALPLLEAPSRRVDMKDVLEALLILQTF